jgi:outer membrane protein TolC
MKNKAQRQLMNSYTGRFRCRPQNSIVWTCLALLLLMIWSSTGYSATPLTLQDVKARAVGFNRSYLSALEEVTKAQSDITKARAGAFPNINVSGSYSRNMLIPSFFVTADNEKIEFKTGFKNNFGASVSLVQSLYQGGKVFSALAIAKLYRKYATAVAGQVESEVVYSAELLFYGSILKKSNLEVLNKAYEAASQNLEVVRKFFGQGMISEYELLRAQVEVNNLKPAILAAESSVRLSEKDLKSFIGIGLSEEITLVEDIDDTSLAGLKPLEEFTGDALAGRPEMQQADNLVQISGKAVRVAKGGYLPSVVAVSSYGWQSSSDVFTLRENTSKSFTAGINVSIPIFNGGYTRGDITMRKAENNQARLALKQTEDQIELEVERAYDQMIQVKKALDIQGATIAQAEEGLKIANLRFETGVGTQLEVLSAQAALTKARNQLAVATFMFRKARAELRKATTVDIF